jgi:hypothetical protein
VKEIEPVQVVKHYRERFAKIEIDEDGSINKGKHLNQWRYTKDDQ